jgi:hypothetical protein
MEKEELQRCQEKLEKLKRIEGNGLQRVTLARE